MAFTVVTTDTTTHAVMAILTLSSGAKVRFPKTQPAGWASAATYQTAMQAEVLNSLNAAQSQGNNSAHSLASMA